MVKNVANFTITYDQYLDASGNLCKNLPDFANDTALVLDFYKRMTLARVFDQKAITLQRTGKLGTYPSILGHEAIGVGLGQAMQAEDVFLPYYRDHGVLLQRGVTMAEIYTYWGGDERGNDYQIPREDFPPCIPIATQSLHATGVATAFKLRRQKRVAVTTIGEGGTSEGDFYEAINVAGAWRLPVVFMVYNNQWAISVPRDKQTATETIAQKAIAAGIPGEQIDGNDIIAVYHASRNAIQRAREGHGATVIEAITYRLSDHTTADDAKRYRDDQSVADAWTRDPVTRLKTYLTTLSLWDDQQETAWQENCKKQVEQQVEIYLSAKPEPASAMFDYLYATLPEELLEQRAIAMQFGVQHD